MFDRKIVQGCSTCQEITACNKCQNLIYKNLSQKRVDTSCYPPVDIYFCSTHEVKWSRMGTIWRGPCSLKSPFGKPRVIYYLNNVKCSSDGVPL